MPVPLQPSGPRAEVGDGSLGAVHRRRVKGVLFDFHGTLAQVEDPVDWVVLAARACGVTMDPARAAGLAERLVGAGRAGGPLPKRVPPQLAKAFADRDLSTAAHRAAYTGLAATVASGIDGLADALYERLLRPEGWVVYPDTVPALRGLQAAGIPVAVVSNIGFDIRPLLRAFGCADLVDATVLSYEVGRCKPDPELFRHACGLLGVHPRQTLMVGDTTADAAAVHAGCMALTMPASGPGEINGLAVVLDLIERDGHHI